MSEKHLTFPSALEAVFLVLGLFLAESFGLGLLSGLNDALGMDASEQGALVTVLANGIIFTVVMQLKGLSYRTLFHSSTARADVMCMLMLPPILLLMPGLLLAMSLLIDAVVSLAPMSPQEEAMFAALDGRGLASVLSICLLAPVLEEMLFRGIVLRSFLRQYARSDAILGAACLFGFAHLNLYQFLVALLFGTLSGWIYERTRSLYPCILLHASYNGAYLILRAFDLQTGRPLLAAMPVLLWPVVVALAMAGTILLRSVLRVYARRAIV